MAQASQLSTERRDWSIGTRIGQVRGLQRIARIGHAGGAPPAGDVGGDSYHARSAKKHAQAFVIRKPEKFVFDDSSACRRAELLHGCWCHRRGLRSTEVVGCVSSTGVATKCISSAMQAVGT